MNRKLSDEELEKFLNMEEKIVWSDPYLLSPNSEDVVFAVKIACKMARERWDWDDGAIQQAIQYADDRIGKAGDYTDWDLEMLQQAVAEDWDLKKINQVLDNKCVEAE